MTDRIEFERFPLPPPSQKPTDGPKIPEKRWNKLEKRLKELDQPAQKAAWWDRHIGFFSLGGGVAFALSGYFLRLGLVNHQMQLAALAFKAMGIGVAVIGIGGSRQRSGLNRLIDDSNKLKGRICRSLGKKPPESDADKRRVFNIYQTSLQQAPWILRYCEPALIGSELKATVTARLQGIEQKVEEKRLHARRARYAAVGAAIGGGAVLLSVASGKGIALILPYGISALCVCLAAAIQYDAHHRLRRFDVKQARSLVDYAGPYDPTIWRENPTAVSRIDLTQGSEDYHLYRGAKRLKSKTWPADEAFSSMLKRFTTHEAAPTLETLPVGIKAICAKSYCPQKVESLKKYKKLRVLKFQTVRGLGLDTLATARRIDHLQIEEADTLRHPVFRKVKKFTTRGLAHLCSSESEVNRNFAVRILVLLRPTTACVDHLDELTSVEEIVLHHDVGLSLERVTSLLAGPNLRKITIMNFENKAGWTEADLKDISGNYDIVLGDKDLKSEEFKRVTELTRDKPGKVTIRCSF